MTHPKSQWTEIIERDPQHSIRYAMRFERMAAEGHDLFGEARLVDAMVGRESAILDAGSGPGRLGGYLADRGHRVTGVDVDPYLIDVARTQHPNATWIVADLADLDLPDRFDLIFSAGNVMGFLHPDTRVEVLTQFARHLAPEGRAVIGFGAGRGYLFDDFFADAVVAGLRIDAAFSTWDLRPFDERSGFLVAVLSGATPVSG